MQLSDQLPANLLLKPYVPKVDLHHINLSKPELIHSSRLPPDLLLPFKIAMTRGTLPIQSIGAWEDTSTSAYNQNFPSTWVPEYAPTSWFWPYQELPVTYWTCIDYCKTCIFVATNTDSENWYPQSERTRITSTMNWEDPVEESGWPSQGIRVTQSKNWEYPVKESGLLGIHNQGIGVTQSKNWGYPVKESVFWSQASDSESVTVLGEQCYQS